jgi:hypothetical protein
MYLEATRALRSYIEEKDSQHEHKKSQQDCDKAFAPDKHDDPPDTSNVSSMVAATDLPSVG